MANRWMSLSFGLAAMAIVVIFGIHAGEETARVAADEGELRFTVMGAIALAALGVMVGILAMLRTLLSHGHLLWFIAAGFHGAAAVAYVAQVRDWGFAALLVATALEVVAGRLMRHTTQAEHRGPPTRDTV